MARKPLLWCPMCVDHCHEFVFPQVTWSHADSDKKVTSPGFYSILSVVIWFKLQIRPWRKEGMTKKNPANQIQRVQASNSCYLSLFCGFKGGQREHRFMSACFNQPQLLVDLISLTTQNSAQLLKTLFLLNLFNKWKNPLNWFKVLKN